MKVLLSILLLVMLSHYAKCQNSADSLIKVLKFEILNKKNYENQRNARILALKNELAKVLPSNFPDQYIVCNKLYNEYQDFVFDSAHVYTSRLLKISSLMHDLPKQYDSKIKLGRIQLTWGMFKETFETLQQIRVNALPDSIKLRYYELKSRAYTNEAMYNTDEFYSSVNRAASIKAIDSAIYFSKPESYEKYRHVAELLTIQGKRAQAAVYYRKLLDRKSLSYHERAMVANDLSNLEAGQERVKLITLAAIYDIRAATKETLAVFTLGNILFKQGNIKDAQYLLTEALSEARFYGNKIHITEIVAILTTVSAQKLINSENEKNRVLTFLIILLGIAILSTLIIAWNVYVRLKAVKVREQVVREQNQHLDKINKRLLEDSHIKEEYIGYFFDVISGYILKLEKIKRNLERKVKTKSFEDILVLANEIDIKQERHNLFYTFDNIFLKLFPNFIITFNSLLNPEDQVWPKDNEILNTNLRIFALMRLGIKDSQKIANILENTISTIYTYKTRIKSKAVVHGDEFDNKIMEIKFGEISEGLDLNN